MFGNYAQCLRLHNEILDFYEFVAPQAFEQTARKKLVGRISQALGKIRLFETDSGSIQCFGSYPAGLYLPTADMDLVYVSDGHFRGGPPTPEVSVGPQRVKQILQKVARQLDKAHILAARPNLIHKARVPIIKFQDSVTGLDVDISFENLGGVQAQATFEFYKETYGDMVYLVALVKQFLVMRGLNEVHTGGLGGLSVICLVVSYLHHHQKEPGNLGSRFIGFLEYYGKKFNLATQRIQMNPPDIVRKVRRPSFSGFFDANEV